MVGVLYTLYVWVVCFFTFFSHYLLCFFIVRFLPNATEHNYRLAAQFLRCGMALCRIRYRVVGLENIPKDHVFILIANHQSLLDIVIMMMVMPRRFSFVAKKELLQVPIVGWDIRSQGHVPVDRSNPRASAEVLAGLGLELAANHPLLFFPEGTRSPDGKLQVFKRGPFQLAVNTGVSLVPCLLSGTGHILPKRGFRVHPGSVTVHFGKEIEVEKIEDASAARELAKDLAQRCQDIISKLG
ncbi:MAG: 1-acyl-sn-glycerol-3-phosphate acyltransferase [Candidatus Margulisbacteria bacterium]|nr:1-acyl-sn-glycerol-3-phosphate acyltransferase [Candidatus Margulisiibacteriota bacterium]